MNSFCISKVDRSNYQRHGRSAGNVAIFLEGRAIGVIRLGHMSSSNFQMTYTRIRLAKAYLSV